MSEQKREINKSEISPELMEKIMAKIIEEFETLVSDPRWGPLYDIEDLEKIKKGEKIQPYEMARGTVTRICQDFRLWPEQTDIIIEKIFEEKK